MTCLQDSPKVRRSSSHWENRPRSRSLSARGSDPHRRPPHQPHRGASLLEHQIHTCESVHLTYSWTLSKRRESRHSETQGGHKIGHSQKRADSRSAPNDWCERGDSNPHGLPRQILSLVRLPIPPLSHALSGPFPRVESGDHQSRCEPVSIATSHLKGAPPAPESDV